MDYRHKVSSKALDLRVLTMVKESSDEAIQRQKITALETIRELVAKEWKAEK